MRRCSRTNGGLRVAELALIAALASGCGSEDSPAATTDGGTSGVVPCAAGETTRDDGTCQPAGVPPEQCAAGFGPDETNGCSPILPPRPCGMGLVALPGETTCHELAPCGTGRWGDIVIEPTTEHVDASYTGADSDGSAAKPWLSIQEAVDAAEPGATVAVAAGSYQENVSIAGSAVRLWGRCPEMVEIVPAGGAPATLTILEGAAGTEVRDLAVRGPGVGVAISGAEEVLLDRVWIHDAATGLHAENTLGPTSLTLARSLVDANNAAGVLIIGASASIDATVVRDGGRAINIQKDLAGGQRANVNVLGSVIERNRELGVFAGGSDARIEGTLIRDTQPRSSDDRGGTGILLESDDAGDAAVLTLVASVLQANRSGGMLVDSSDAHVDGSVIRDTLPQASDQHLGDGIVLRNEASNGLRRATLALRTSVIERNTAVGIGVAAADVTVESSIIRDTLPDAADQRGGYGLIVTSDATGAVATANIRSCVFARNRAAGIAVMDSNAVIDGSLVLDTQPLASDGRLGDGVAVLRVSSTASATLTACEIRGSVRAGVTAFGATAGVGKTVLECNAFHLVGESYPDAQFMLDDLGENSCGCAGSEVTCQVESPGLEPPEAIALQ